MARGRGGSSARNWDESDVRVRPGKGCRPRTKRRPSHDDAATAMVVSVDRGRWGCVLLGDGPDHVAGTRVVTMRAREFGRTPVVVGDHVGVVGPAPSAGSRVVTMRAREFGRTPVVVGDHVGVAGDLSGTRDTLARIVRVEDRSTVLRRTADDPDPYDRVVVANAQLLLIVVA